MSTKANCFNCVHRRGVPGDAHSACATLEGPAAFAVSAAFMRGVTGLNSKDGAPVLRASPQGVRNGWFLWPVNFDPVWLEYCAMYETHSTKEADRA